MKIVDRFVDKPTSVRRLLKVVLCLLLAPIISMSIFLLLVNCCVFFASPAIGRSMLMISLAIGFIPIGANRRLSSWLRCFFGLLYIIVGVPLLYTYSLLFMGFVFDDWL
jgi:hypothetical protein